MVNIIQCKPKSVDCSKDDEKKQQKPKAGKDKCQARQGGAKAGAAGNKGGQHADKPGTQKGDGSAAKDGSDASKAPECSPSPRPPPPLEKLPEVEPIGLVLPEPLSLPELSLPMFSFQSAALRLSRSQLKLPPPQQGQEDEVSRDKAVSDVFDAVQGLNREAGLLQSIQQETARDRARRVAEAFALNRNALLADQYLLDARLLENYRNLVLEGRAQRLQALSRIEAMRQRERLSVMRAGGGGRQALRNKIKTADAVIDSTVKSVMSPYQTTLEEATAKANKDVAGLKTTLDQWQLKPLQEGGGAAMRKAKDEGRRQTADCLVKELRDRVNCNGPKMVARFKSALAPLQALADSSLRPPMQQAKQRAEQCGFAALSGAVSNGIQMIERSAEQGRDRVQRTSASGERLLTRQLNAARRTLRDQAEARLHKFHKESKRSQERLSETHNEQQQGVAESLQSYHESLLDAAPKGHQTLRGAAVDGAAETGDTFKKFRAAYRDQSHGIEQGTRRGLKAGYTRFVENSNQAVEQQNQAAWQQSIQSRERSELSLTQRGDGIAQITDGVQKAANQWGQGLAEQFAKQIQATGESLKGCEAGFKQDIGEARSSLAEWVAKNSQPETLYASQLQQIAAQVKGDVEKREKAIADEMDDMITGDEKVADAVRGVTKPQGDAIYEIYDSKGHSLLLDIARSTSGDDKRAILAYLSGDQAKGAEYELKASKGIINDDEARIRKVLRSLDQDTLKAFVKDESVKQTLVDVRDVLGGVDRDVFDTLIDATLDHSTRLARADFMDLEHNIKRAGTREEINQELSKFYSNAKDRGYGNEVTDKDLRRLINDQAAVVKNVTDEKGDPVTGEKADAVVKGVVTKRHAVLEQFEQARCGRAGCHRQGALGERHKKFQQAQEDRAFALIGKGVGSVDERIAQLGVEAHRAAGGKAENIDRALVDPRLNPNRDPRNDKRRYPNGKVPKKVLEAYEKQRNQALAERQQILAGVAAKHGDPRTAGTAGTADQVTALLGRGKSKLGKDVIGRLVEEPFPTAKTTALILEYSAKGLGTNESLMKQATQRLDRDQIAAAAASYKGLPNAEYSSLWDLVSSETSGADFQEMELAWIGQPRDDRERAEVALFALHQQKRDAGWLGRDLMSGSRVEAIMQRDEARLRGQIGGKVIFSKPGEPPKVTIANGNFNKQGQFKGDRADFAVNTEQARESAKLYAKNIDEWANGVTTAIAIIGAIVATVVTGGGASPLLAAAIAGATGLAGMAAKEAIKGGRYGWEEGLTDLGMTGVQMLTAGLGQKLQALAQAGKLGGPIQQALIPAVVTGSLDSLGQTVLSENTWKDGFGKGLEEALAGTFRGALTATVATLGTMALQKIPLGKVAGQLDDVADDVGAMASRGRTLGDVAGESSNWLSRGAAQSLSSGGGAFLSRGAELGFETLRGKYKGDAGDIFVEMTKAGGQAALQGFGEGVGEAWRDRNKIKFGLYVRPNWMDPVEYQRLTASEQVRTGTAAAVEGSRFRGDLHASPQVDNLHVTAGLNDLAGEGGFMHGRLTVDPEGQGNSAQLRLEDGGEIPVKVEVVDTMPAVDGRVPVARFEGNAAEGYTIKISSRADPELVQRALVHELTEIRHEARPNPSRDDLLKPGSLRGKAGDEPAQLSPHDHARIAEVEFTQQQLRRAESVHPVNSQRVGMLREELHSLLAHLGVVNAGEGPDRRRALLFDNLSDPNLQAQLNLSIAESRQNPRLKHRGIDHQAALDFLVERWQRHVAVGDLAAADGLLTLIQRRLMRMQIIGTDRRRSQQQSLDDAMAQHITQPEVIAALKQRLIEDPKIGEARVRRDPAEADPDGAQAARREFGDRKLFQDWGEFREAYFQHRKGVDPGDPVHVDQAYHQWVTGGYISESTGRVRSVLSDVDRPDPGFGHRFVDDRKPTEFERAKLADDLVLSREATGVEHDTAGLKELAKNHDADLSKELKERINDVAGGDSSNPSTVKDAYELRQQLLDAAQAIRNNPDLSPAEVLRLEPLLKALLTQAAKLSETLGEAAAHRFAREYLGNDWEPVKLEGRGSGLPDVVYRHKETGQLVLIEAKGGTAGLITRSDVTGTRRVEQGTPEYLRSLAKEMQKPSRPESTRRLGAEIERQLAVGQLQYHLVKQKFDNDGRPRIPEQARFELGKSPATAEQGHRAAAPVPESAFHGEALIGDQIAQRHATDAAVELALAGEGIGASLVQSAGDPSLFIIEHPDGRRTEVRLEVVPAADLPEVNGERANAVWDDDPGGSADFVIRISDQMDPDQVQRALAHDFREVNEVAFEGGARQQADAFNEHGLALNSPHGRARLEEIQWLAARMAQGDSDGEFRSELDALLRHLGAETEQSDQRRLEIFAVLEEQGGLTPAVWRELNVADAVQRAILLDAEGHARAAGALQGIGQEHLLQRIAELGQNLRALVEGGGEATQRLGELIAERESLLEQIQTLGTAELSVMFHAHNAELPTYEALAAARDGLFQALGVEPLSHSRQDMENFLRVLWEAGEAGDIYDRYSASAVPKAFSSEEAAQQHRRALLESVRNPPEGILVEPQDPPLRLLQEIMDIPVSGEPANDFIHFTRALPEGADSAEATYRVYINTQSDETIALLNDIVANLIRPDDNDAYKAKTHSGADELNRRAEGVVVYTQSAEGLQHVLNYLMTFYGGQPGRFVPAVPRMTQPVAHGIATGAEPRTRGSFGGVRSNAIAAALRRIRALPQDQQTFESFRELVFEEMRRRHVDPEQPHLNLNQPAAK